MTADTQSVASVSQTDIECLHASARQMLSDAEDLRAIHAPDGEWFEQSYQDVEARNDYEKLMRLSRQLTEMAKRLEKRVAQ